MHVIAWILFGLIVGLIARLVVPGPNPHGIVVTTLIGIAGALLGGWIGRAVGHYQPGQGAGWLMSIFGAIILLVIYHLIARPRRTI